MLFLDFNILLGLNSLINIEFISTDIKQYQTTEISTAQFFAPH